MNRSNDSQRSAVPAVERRSPRRQPLKSYQAPTLAKGLRLAELTAEDSKTSLR